MTAAIRRFHAQGLHAEAHAHAVEAVSFEAAAVAYVERWAPADDECRVSVLDIATGERHCFALGFDGIVEGDC